MLQLLSNKVRILNNTVNAGVNLICTQFRKNYSFYVPLQQNPILDPNGNNCFFRFFFLDCILKIFTAIVCQLVISKNCLEFIKQFELFFFCHRTKLFISQFDCNDTFK